MPCATRPLEEIKDAIRVAGMYNQKAPHIVETLELLHREKGRYSLEHVREMAPAAAQTYLQRFPGVGHKTASIVLLFSYGMAAFPVDTHVQRVTQRLGLSGRRASAEKIKSIWEEMLPEETYFCLHVNLIRHGRTVCSARTPRCAVCVLQRRVRLQRAYRRLGGSPSRLGIKHAKSRLKRTQAACGWTLFLSRFD